MLRDLNSAFALLTTLPTPNFYPDEAGRAYAYFPLVGLVIGSLLWLAQVCLGYFFPVEVSAFLMLGLWVLLTGGLHLDGFGDTCDGVFAAVEPARRLDIMKDPRTGSWAVIGLILLLLGKWVGLQTHPPLILAAVSARFIMVIATYYFPYARKQGMGAHFRQGFGRQQVFIATLSIFVTSIIFWRSMPMLLLIFLLIFGVARWLAHRLGGGLTGDTYGALCELTELLVILLV